MKLTQALLIPLFLVFLGLPAIDPSGDRHVPRAGHSGLSMGFILCAYMGRKIVSYCIIANLGSEYRNVYGPALYLMDVKE